MFLPTSWQQSSAISNELINLIVDEAWNSSFTLLAAPWQRESLRVGSPSSPPAGLGLCACVSATPQSRMENVLWKGHILIWERASRKLKKKNVTVWGHEGHTKFWFEAREALSWTVRMCGHVRLAMTQGQWATTWALCCLKLELPSTRLFFYSWEMMHFKEHCLKWETSSLQFKKRKPAKYVSLFKNIYMVGLLTWFYCKFLWNTWNLGEPCKRISRLLLARF